ncbi:MAG: hypothetical protein AAF645_03990 [Myxococcota bacterium]
MRRSVLLGFGAVLFACGPSDAEISRVRSRADASLSAYRARIGALRAAVPPEDVPSMEAVCTPDMITRSADGLPANLVRGTFADAMNLAEDELADAARDLRLPNDPSEDDLKRIEEAADALDARLEQERYRLVFVTQPATMPRFNRETLVYTPGRINGVAFVYDFTQNMAICLQQIRAMSPDTVLPETDEARAAHRRELERDFPERAFRALRLGGYGTERGNH